MTYVQKICIPKYATSEFCKVVLSQSKNPILVLVYLGAILFKIEPHPYYDFQATVQKVPGLPAVSHDGVTGAQSEVGKSRLNAMRASACRKAVLSDVHESYTTPILLPS